MDASELRARALEEADELGPEPIGSDRDLWLEERRGAIILLSALADHDPAVLRRAAPQVADELADREARALVLDAAADAVIESRRQDG